MTSLADCACLLLRVPGMIAPQKRNTHLAERSLNRTTDGDKLMATYVRTLAIIPASIGALLILSSASYAQIATTLEQAELAGLSPEKRAEVQARAVNGNTVSEVLQTILLNSIKLKHPASRIVALDFGRGIAVVELTSGKTDLVQFDTTTLAIKD